MPLYSYICPNCGEFDEFKGVADREKCKCPDCGTMSRKQVTSARLDYYNMGVQDGLPTALDKWEKMHKKEARRKYNP